jgi:HlyD family secretion protein
MDIQRPDLARKRRVKKGVVATVALVLLAGAGVWVMRMEPRVPAVPRENIWMGTVERGQMDITVRGIGSLVPETVRWIAAETEGRVEAIRRLPGEAVEPDSILVELSNPDLVQELSRARFQLLSHQADLENQRAAEEDRLLEMEFELARLKADLENAALDVHINEELFRDGLVAERELLRARSRNRQAREQTEIMSRRVEQRSGQIDRRLAPFEAAIEQMKEQVGLLENRVDRLTVRAGMNGVLQRLPVEAGQRVSAGQEIAQVADPRRLKAVVRVPETQARAVQIGQATAIDARFVVIHGTVSRVNPTVESGTVDVEVRFADAELPNGVRADLTVEGIIELSRLTDAVFVGRPAAAREHSNASLFRLTSDGYARRVMVQFGPASVRHIAVLNGLEPGDQVILSDMSDWQERDVVRVR